MGDRFWNRGPMLLRTARRDALRGLHAAALSREDRGAGVPREVGHTSAELKPARSSRAAWPPAHRDQRRRGTSATTTASAELPSQPGGEVKGTEVGERIDFAGDHPAFRLSMLEATLCEGTQDSNELSENSNLDSARQAPRPGA